MGPTDRTPAPPGKPLPLILFPGMGSNAALFQLQRLEFPEMIVPPWIMPRPSERLEAYADRLAAAVDPGGPCLVGGTSFGGIMALEVARRLPVRACLLIASIRTPRQLPWWFRLGTPFARTIPRISANVSALLARGVEVGARRWLPKAARSALTQYAARDGAYQRWAAIAVLRWKPPRTSPPFPVFQIHGERDRVFPARRIQADALVSNGGHLLTLTHPFAVNAFLRRSITACLNAAGAEQAAPGGDCLRGELTV